MSKYSPRPWRVGMRYGNNRTEINDAHGNAVATVWTHDVKRIEKPAGSAADYGVNERGMANAVLIALSPELLESLRDMIDEAESLRVEYNEVRCRDGYPDEPAAKCVDQARAVLAKVGDIATADVTDEN